VWYKAVVVVVVVVIDTGPSVELIAAGRQVWMKEGSNNDDKVWFRGT
jgi:DNA-binding sugar fermentation-stimulating protein